ncbi:MAG: glycosyltransferase, partial [Anaerolineales bacterium]|nr:glycosyltransferase [Anaerolineales bacterium]
EAQELLAEMEIIHCHHLFMSVEMAHRYGRCPVVYTNHTRYDLYTGAYIPIPQPTADAIMRQIWPEFTDLADVIVTPSASVRQIMLDFGVRQPIQVIENGVDLRPFRHPAAPLSKSEMGVPETAVLFVYVGRLSPEKNLPLLLEQFAIAHDIVPDIHLLLIGQGTVQAALQQQAAEFGIANQVHFTGSLTYADIPNYLAAADAFVTASVTEVHPLTIIEAMGAGLPVAAPVAPGIIDTVQSQRSGLLTHYPEQGLAAAMVGLAVDASRRQMMGTAAAADSERFDISHTVAKTVELYKWLRVTRPDLKRQKAHGRWTRNRERLQPLLDQLSNVLKPQEKRETGPLGTIKEKMTNGVNRTNGEW